MQVFYINLDHRTDRRRYIDGELASAGLVGERIAALSPADIDADVLRHAMRRQGADMSAPELACALSHMKAWQRLLDLGLLYAAIFEDDVRLSRRLAACLGDIAAANPKADVIRLETQFQPVCVGPATDRLGCGVDLLPFYSEQWGMGGYIMSAGLAKRLLADPHRLDLPVDALVFSDVSPLFGAIEKRQCQPALCLPGEMVGKRYDGSLWRSDIETERRDRFHRAKLASAGAPGRLWSKVPRELHRLARQFGRVAGSGLGYVLRSRRWVRIPFEPGSRASIQPEAALASCGE